MSSCGDRGITQRSSGLGRAVSVVSCETDPLFGEQGVKDKSAKEIEKK